MKPRSKQGSSNNKVYAVIGVIVTASVLYAAWPSISGNSVSDELLQRLMDENERLQQESLRGQPVAAAFQAAPAAAACNCDYAERAREDAERAKRSLEREVREVRDELVEVKARAAAAAAAAANAVVPAAPAASRDVALPIPSCRNQKLEFLRWQKDENGRVKTCPFTPENYDNWTKMPPLCDYLSIECLGEGNKRAAHVFGFGGPGLMIGISDQWMWEFVLARHQQLSHIVELGTMTGGTSLYLGMAANVRGGQFHSFDRSDNRAKDSKRGWLPNMIYHVTDILTDVHPDRPETHNQQVVQALNTGEPVLALFDNGDKKKETDIYARYMAVGSILLLHDWEHLDLPRPHWEMTYSMVAKTLEKLGFEKRYHDFAEHIGSSTRAFQRVSEGPLDVSY